MRGLLFKLQAVFDLPRRVRTALEQDAVEIAVEHYAEAAPLLKRYGHKVLLLTLLSQKRVSPPPPFPPGAGFHPAKALPSQGAAIGSTFEKSPPPPPFLSAPPIPRTVTRCCFLLFCQQQRESPSPPSIPPPSEAGHGQDCCGALR